MKNVFEKRINLIPKDPRMSPEEEKEAVDRENDE
jgi:hypothetical protein